MKISLIQMNSQSDKADNIAQARELVAEAAKDSPDLVVLPELWAVLSADREQLHASGETFPDGDACHAMREMAMRHKITLHGGSIVEKDGNSFHNATIVFNPEGEVIAKYRKMHLFDVDVPNGISFRESSIVAPGSDLVTYECAGHKIGCAICYDLRFPELFRGLRDLDVDVIILPSAFTLMTGKDHWEVLSRSRAIETQTTFVAVNQVGSYSDGTHTSYGHSMLINPWGHVVAQVGDHTGHVTARVDDEYVAKVRANVPVHLHHVL